MGFHVYDLFPSNSKWWKKDYPIERNPQKPAYFWFDSPDYDDCSKKLWFGTKIGLQISGTAMLGSAMTCAVANWRGQKDDELNYIIGFGSTGLIWGMRFRNTAIGCAAAAAMGFAAFFTKRTYVKNWQIMIPDDIENTNVMNGARGGQRFGDWRIRSKTVDPGIGNRSVD